jgi:hypothetical protein
LTRFISDIKTKKGEIKSKGIARERWYIHMQEIKVENGNILIDYISDDKEHKLNIELDKVEDSEMLSDLSGIEEQLVKMYTENQSVYKDANVYHKLRH